MAAKAAQRQQAMIALLCFVLAALGAPFKSKSRLGVGNAALRHKLIVLQRKVHGRARLTNNDRWYLTVSLVSVDPADSHNHQPKDAPALAPGRLLLLLALEIASTGRAAAD